MEGAPQPTNSNTKTSPLWCPKLLLSRANQATSKTETAAQGIFTLSSTQDAQCSALAELTNFLQKFYQGLARIYRFTRACLHKANAKQCFLLLAERAAAIGLDEL